MLQVTLGSLRTSTRRYAATALAIVLGVGFVAATLVVSATLGASVRARITDDLARYAVVVTAATDGPNQTISASALVALSGLDGVAGVEGTVTTHVRIAGSAENLTAATTWHQTPTLRTVSGAGPASADQVVVSTSIATRAGLAPGSPITVTDASGTDRHLTVSGVVDTSGSGRFSGRGLLLATPATMATLSGSTGLDQIGVVGRPGVDDATLRGSVASTIAATPAAAPGGGAPPTVRTGADEADARVRDALRGTESLTLLLLAFAAVALFVSALVIANTFAILVAQRVQQLALLRCVGATSRQVFGSVLLESVTIGVGGSALGVGLGIGAAAVVSAVSGRFDTPFPLQQLGISASSIVLPILAGTLVTVIAALFPALGATRVAPLAALRSEAPASTRTRAGFVRLVSATVLFVGGTAGLVLGARAGQLAIAIPGGMVSFVGVLVGAVAVVPALVRVMGTIPRRLAGTPADLAVENAVRNPSRAAATSSALLVGVTLITMMSVAAVSAQGAIEQYLSARYPVDAQVTAVEGALTAKVIAAVGRTDGVARTVTLTRADLRVGTGGGAPESVVGVPTDTIGSVLRSDAQTSLALVRPGTIVVAGFVAGEHGLTDGGRTLLGSRPVTVHVVEQPFAPVMAATSDFAAAGATPQTGTLLVRLSDGSDPGPVLDRLGVSLSGVQGVSVDGAAPQRVEFQGIVDVVLLIVTGLLAVAVLIALVGVGNTVALSVLERARESALLRALGLNRGQLRGSLGIEAALLAVVGALLGTLLGVGYGYAGATALLGAIAPVPLVIPWSRLLLVVVIALVAGVAAAWLPSRRAARVAPATALAIE